jgi:hypothetical protein
MKIITTHGEFEYDNKKYYLQTLNESVHVLKRPTAPSTTGQQVAWQQVAWFNRTHIIGIMGF